MEQQNNGTYGLPKLDGLLSLEMHKVVLESNLGPGDPVSIFMAPDKKFVVVKDDKADLKIEAIGSGYITFDRPILERGGKQTWVLAQFGDG